MLCSAAPRPGTQNQQANSFQQRRRATRRSQTPFIARAGACRPTCWLARPPKQKQQLFLAEGVHAADATCCHQHNKTLPAASHATHWSAAQPGGDYHHQLQQRARNRQARPQAVPPQHLASSLKIERPAASMCWCAGDLGRCTCSPHQVHSRRAKVTQHGKNALPIYQFVAARYDEAA